MPAGRLIVILVLVGAAAAPALGAPLWITPEEIAQLPTTGAAWARVLDVAGDSCTADLSRADDDCKISTYARSLAWARDPQTYASMRSEAIADLRTVACDDTQNGGVTLDVCETIGAYFVAADVLQVTDGDPGCNGTSGLRSDLIDFGRDVRTQDLSGKTIISTQESKYNGWGNKCCWARATIDAYIGDTVDLDRAAEVFKAYLGEPSEFEFDPDGFGDLSWQCDESDPGVVMPPGCTKVINGAPRDLDGALPEELRRGSSATWPPPTPSYVWTSPQSLTSCAEVFHRQGYDSYNWGSQALRRVIAWLHRDHGGNYPFLSSQAGGDDMWVPWILNTRYDGACEGQDCPQGNPTRLGKTIDFTNWTHANGTVVEEPPTGDVPAPGNLRRMDVVP